MIGSLLRRAREEASYLPPVLRSGLVRPVLPHRLPGLAGAAVRYSGIGVLPALAAARHPDRTAVVDELGTLTYAEIDRRSNALANTWLAGGLQPGEGVAILARNHRGFLDALFAAGKCGARVILLNTDFAGPQIREVADREGTHLLVYDEEYAAMLEGVTPVRGTFRAWARTPGPDTLEALIASGDPSPPPRSGRSSRIVLLTSGTTGTPKGAPRSEPRSLEPIAALLERVPFRAGGVTEVAAPLFHTLGFGMALLAYGMGSTLVLRRRFDPVALVDSLAIHGVRTLVAVPVMLQRLVDLPDDAYAGRDLSPLRIVFVAGSQLGADLCVRVTERFGPVVYNLYGSTEVAYATIATPEDLAAEPGCVGRPVLGTTVRLYDDAGLPVAVGETGRIFVGNAFQFDGYTGGGTKEVIDGLMSSGDVGHFDAHGRLFIDGRDDDMIVSGGENVFPGEVEELLAGHPDVVEVAVVGVDDEQFGQRLAAYVVPRTEALTEDGVRSYVARHLARFKTPRDVHFLAELPRNPTGKVLKGELRR